MPVFISYSHADKAFANKLAVNLVDARVSVWLDRWELKVGDSLIEKIQDGLQDASALLVLLSKNSVESAWCKTELSAGLLRELEERKIVVLPILLEDCRIPLLLRGKVYADFRTNFDEGWHSVIEGISGVTSLEMGRITDESYHVDWSERWGETTGEPEAYFFVQYTLVQASQEWEHSILSEIFVMATEEATKRYNQYREAGLDWVGRFIILESVATVGSKAKMRVLLEDSFPKHQELTILDPKTGLGYVVRITTQRLGQDHGKDIMVDCAQTIKMVYEQTKARMRKLTATETERLRETLSN